MTPRLRTTDRQTSSIDHKYRKITIPIHKISRYFEAEELMMSTKN